MVLDKLWADRPKVDPPTTYFDEDQNNIGANIDR